MSHWQTGISAGGLQSENVIPHGLESIPCVGPESSAGLGSHLSFRVGAASVGFVPVRMPTASALMHTIALSRMLQVSVDVGIDVKLRT